MKESARYAKIVEWSEEVQLALPSAARIGYNRLHEIQTNESLIVRR